MKNPKLILGAIAGVALAALLFRPVRSSEPAAERSNSVAASAVPSLAEVPPAAEHSQVSSSPAPKKPVVEPPELASALADPRLLKAEQVLATVNGKPIRLSDLISLAPDETEKAITAEQYESRLTRAVEMELTFQAAQAQAVTLTKEQQRRLNKITEDHQARLAEFKQQGISWSSVTSAQLEFEKRLTSALMLQQNFVAKEASVAPSPDVAVQARYEQVLHDLLARLKANADVRMANPAL